MEQGLHCQTQTERLYIKGVMTREIWTGSFNPPPPIQQGRRGGGESPIPTGGTGSALSNADREVIIKGLVINYGEGGLQNGKIAGPKLFAPPLKTG